MTQFAMLFAPPERPVPAPRGTTRTSCAAAQMTVADTSSVVVASTTASGVS